MIHESDVPESTTPSVQYQYIQLLSMVYKIKYGNNDYVPLVSFHSRQYLVKREQGTGYIVSFLQNNKQQTLEKKKTQLISEAVDKISNLRPQPTTSLASQSAGSYNSYP